MVQLIDLTAEELHAGYRSGDFTPVEVTEAVLDRIASAQEAINAFVLVDPDAALDEARRSTQRWQAGRPLSTADGVPTSVKDLIPTRGWPTRRGSALIGEEGPWETDGPSVARLRRAGAVLLGKTTTPEFAWKPLGDCRLTGMTRNPRALDKTPGGSSAGSAAALAAGMGPWSLGTDGGGSVRIPAAFTGVVGVKPTYGTVPLYPPSPFGTLSHVGPMARSVTDLARFLDIIAGHHPQEWNALPDPSARFADTVEEGVAGLAVAYSPTLGYGKNHPEVESAVRRAVEKLEEHGAVVEEADPGFADPAPFFHTLWFTAAAKVLAAFPTEALEKVDAGLRQRAEEFSSSSADDYLTAMAARMDLGALMGEFHQRYDLLITPTTPTPAFPCHRQAPEGWPEGHWTSWSPYTYPFNMTQQPAASVPCGTVEGLPVGVQIVGPRLQDQLVLRAARVLELIAEEQFIRPAPWAKP